MKEILSPAPKPDTGQFLVASAEEPDTFPLDTSASDTDFIDPIPPVDTFALDSSGPAPDTAADADTGGAFVYSPDVPGSPPSFRSQAILNLGELTLLLIGLLGFVNWVLNLLINDTEGGESHA